MGVCSIRDFKYLMRQGLEHVGVLLPDALQACGLSH